MLKCLEMFNRTLFQRLWMNLPEVPQGKHTERPRGQRGKPRGGSSRLCKTDGREERGQLSGLETGSSPDAAMPPAPPQPALRASPPGKQLRAPPTAPSGLGAPHAPAAQTEPQGWAEGSAQGARATLEQVARRRFGTERVNPVRAHSPPSPKLGLPRRPAAHPEKAPRHPSTARRRE